MVKTSPSSAKSTGSIPGQEAKIPHASRPKTQNIKQKQYCNNFNEVFRNGSHFLKNLLKRGQFNLLGVTRGGEEEGPGPAWKSVWILQVPDTAGAQPLPSDNL